jgi:hypothetical protein
MKVIALLAWYDENPAWLERCITSLSLVPVSTVIALDGAYQHYPGGEATSDPAQVQAIADACTVAGIGFSIPPVLTVWPTELDKRNAMFAHAEQAAEPGDWYMVIDADEFVTHAPPDTLDRLKASPFDVAAVTLDEPGHPLGTIRFGTFPMFFRAIPGTRVVGEHFRYVTPDNRLLWGDAKREHLEPRWDLTDLTVEHHTQLRHEDRRRAARDYYDTRDRLGLEDLPANRSLLAR